MLIYNFLFAKGKKFKSKVVFFWLALSLLFSGFYSYLGLQQAFSSQYIIQDDARQHVFWMLRFTDANLFPKDLIADYFQSVAPAGYSFLYWIVNQIGIDPISFSKLLPGILGLIVTSYCFALTLELIPLPFTGFVASLLLNQNLWLQDGLISGTPKAFAPPLLVAFLYYFVQRSVLGISLTILLFGLFYPSLVFVCCGLLILSLFSYQNGRIAIVNQKQNYIFAFTGLIVAFFVLLPYAVATSEFSPTITVEQARKLPEFMAGERAAFFNDENPWDFWFNGSRSSLRIPSALMPPLAYLGLLFPLINQRNNLDGQAKTWLKVTSKISVLPKLLIASLIVFFIAHALIFTLHLPSRYTQHSLRIIIILISSIVLTLIWEFLLQKTQQGNMCQKGIFALVALLLAVFLVFYPHTTKRFVWTRYVVGNEIPLYEFLQQQPKNILVASLSEEADNIPSFAQRSILVSREYAIPYHWGYYKQLRQKAVDLIEAQYSNNLAVVKNFITKYGVTHWLLEKSAFDPEYIADNKWIKQHQPVAQNALKNLQEGKPFLIDKLQNDCRVFDSDRFAILDSNCILNQ